MSNWILVADRSRARILTPNGSDNSTLEELADFAHPEGHQRQSDVVTDQQGRFQERGSGQHAGEPETDFKHETAQRFAGEIVEYLEKGRMANRFKRLIVVSPPMFLGVLRGKLPSPLASMVCHEINKDLTQLKVNELASRIPSDLWT
jgi:protein required for attachment to host cells